jgi:hypothetical protein
MGNPKIATCSLLPCVRLHYNCGFSLAFEADGRGERADSDARDGSAMIVGLAELWRTTEGIA